MTLSEKARSFRVHLKAETRGIHKHIRVFINGALAGKLILREDEWIIFTRILNLGMQVSDNDLEITLDGKKEIYIREWDDLW